MGAFASAAQAQSSVTVYGILDVGYLGGNSRASSSSISTNGGNTRITTNKFGQSAETSSRLGFKGTEDLGGGNSAFFTAEFALNPQDQTLSGNSSNKDATSSTAQSGGLANRQAFVGLKKNGLGQFALGTQYTPVFNAGTATNPNGQNNLLGDLVYSPSNEVASTTGAGTTANSQTNRTSNTLTLQSAKFAGFSGNVMYTLSNTNTSSTANAAGQVTGGGNSNASGWGLGADYTYNKFYVTAAYQSLKQLTSATNNGVTTATGTVPAEWKNAQPSAGTSGSAVNVQDNQFLAGATYDFGILKAYAQYITRKATATASSNYYVKRSAEQIGVRSYITPTIEAWASGSLGRYTSFGVNQPTANMNGWQLGSNYYLSKRTNLYAIYGQQVISNSTTYSGVTYSGSGNNYAIGVRHTF